MKIFYSDSFVIPLPDGHRFPIGKYALLRQRVLASGLVSRDELCVARAATDAEIGLVHDADYIRRVKLGQLTRKELLRMGLPWSEALVERARRSCGGTIEACKAAVVDGVAVNLAGGTHHAFPDHGEGYCVFNDCAIAARVMQAEGRVDRLIIVDCDAHQGNGTATIFAGDPSVFTFSIHGAKNFPIRKARSDLDMPLCDGADDAKYLEALETGLRYALARANAQMAIYQAGADPFEGDELGRLALTKKGLAERDKLVFDRCWKEGLPTAVTMGGGYGRHVEEIADIHFQSVGIASEWAERWRRLPDP